MTDAVYKNRKSLYEAARTFLNASDVCKDKHDAIMKCCAILASDKLDGKDRRKMSAALKFRLLNPTVDEINKANEMAEKVVVFIREHEDQILRAAVSNAESDKENRASSRPSYIVEHVDEKTNTVSLVFDNNKLSDWLSEQYNTKFFNQRIYIYDSKQCCYKKATNEIETTIREQMIEHHVEVRSFSYLLKEIISQLSSMGGYSEYPFDSIEDELPVMNGIVKFDFFTETVKLLPHGPGHLFTYKLGAYYDPSVSTDSAIAQLKRLVDDPERLIQIPAQAICQCQLGHPYKKAHLLQGPPNSGKSSFIEILNRLIPKEYIGGVTLTQVCEDRFVGGDLEGKLMNIYDDIEQLPLKTIEPFKTLTGSCQHRIERKFEHSYIGRVTAVHLFTCNFPPWLSTKIYQDAAFWLRWEYIIFENNFGINPEFYDKTYNKEFMSSFLNYLIEAVFRMRKNGLLHNSDIETVMDSWKVNSDPLYDFVDECFVKDDSSDASNIYSKEKLFHLYKLYCRKHNVTESKIKQSLTAFTQSLQALDFQPHKHRAKGVMYPVYQTSAWIANQQVLEEYGIELSFDKPMSLDIALGLPP